MNKIWNNVSQIGTKATESFDYTYQIVLLNRLNVLASIIYLFIGSIYISFGDYKTGLFILSLIFVNSAAFAAQAKHQRLTALSIFLLTSYTSIFYFDSYAGKGAGAYFYYIPTVLSLFFLFDSKKELKLIIAHICSILILFSIHRFTNHSLFHSESVSETMRTNLFMANTSFSALSFVYLLYILLKRK